jgi:NADH-ubiquinone oxidoreductase chain 2
MRIRISLLASQNMTMTIILFILISNAVVLRRDLSILFNRVTIITLIYCILQDFFTLFALTKGVGLQGGLIFMNNTTQTFHIFIFIISIIILELTSFYPRNVRHRLSKINVDRIKNNILKEDNMEEEERVKIIEYPLIILFIITGANLLMSTNDLISIFLSIELQSYGLYLISSIHKNSELSTTGGLIYFLLGGLSSCFILLGTSLLYSNSGTSNLDALYIIYNISDINDINI